MKDHSPSTRPMRGRLAGLRRGLILLAIAASTSCGRSDRIAVHPVEGSVRFGGEPAVGALVVFHPLDASEDFQRLRPAGTVDADGRYVLSTYEPQDGAPPGQYRVTVVWAGPGTGERPGPDRFGGKYANPNASPLTAAVREGGNHLEPFDLQAR